MEDKTKDRIAEGAGNCIGTATPLTAVSVTAVVTEGSMSAAAITSALATIGFGTMMGGFAVLGLSAITVRWCVKKAVRKALK